LIAGAFLCALCIATAPASAHAAPSPSPAATTRPAAFTWNGSTRAYYFIRLNGNTCLASGCNPKGTPDSQAFNTAIKLHGEYDLFNSPWTFGATYFGTEPFYANPFGVLGVGYNPRVDNTLPGYGLSTLAEMYVQYKTPGVFFQTGKEVINTPWANAADSRLVPVAFQGTLLTANVSAALKLGAMYMARYKSRVTSAFNANTLLTSCDTAYPTGKGPIEGSADTFTVEGNQCQTVQSTSGFWMFEALYDNRGLTASAYQYHTYDLADLTYADVKYEYDRGAPTNPFVAAQYWSNNDTGRALIGTVHSHGYGLQYGQNLGRNVSFALGYNAQPNASFIVPAAKCPGTASSGTKPGPGVIFGGVQDTSRSGLPAGEVVCYAGGTASPYTDNYESDPLYTSTIGEGLTDARKAGFAVKAAVTVETNDHRLKALLAQARYNVSVPGTSGGTSNKDIRIETNLDIQYFFNAVDPKAPYRGLSFRERLVDRAETFSPFDFKYIRTQLEFDF
jgi:outer membrane porin, OprD family